MELLKNPKDELMGFRMGLSRSEVTELLDWPERMSLGHELDLPDLGANGI